MLFLAYTLLYLLIFLFGSSIGSFLNVLIYRIPKNIPFWRGRSFCVGCGETIKPYDMVPVFSYLFLRGRCRKCKMKISTRYPLVEIITGLIALLIYWNSGFKYISLIYFTFSSVLIVVSFIDLDTMTIPDGLVIALAVISSSAAFIGSQPGIISRIIGFIAISLPMVIFALAIPESFGGGDIKLIAVCGFMLGWQNVLLATFIALILGGVQGVFIIMKNREDRKKHIAFGQYICIGSFISMLYGNLIIDSYLRIFGLAG